MRKHLHRRLRFDFEPRSICSTGVEEGALLAGAAEGAAAGGAGAVGAGGAGALGAGALGAEALPFGESALLAGETGLGSGGPLASLLSNINPVSLGLQGAGALLKGSAASDAAARKMKLLQAMGQYKTGNANQQTDIVNKYVQGDTPEARAAALQSANDEAKLGFERSVGAAQGFATPDQVSGKVSQQFTDAGTASADAAMARNNKLIASLAAMRAPGLAGVNRSRQYGLAAGQIGGLNTAANDVGNAYGTDIANVQANPWVTMGGDALSGVGQGIALNDAATKNAAILKKALGG